MTSPDQPGQPSGDARKPSDEVREAARHARTPRPGFSLPRDKRGWFWITLSITAAAGVSAALIAVATGGGTDRVTSGGPSSAPVAALGTPSDTSKAQAAHKASNGISEAKSSVISPTKLAESGGALGLPKRMKRPAFAWATGPGGKYLAAVSAQFGAALQESGVRQYPEMRYACTQLGGSVAEAQAGPRIPDAAMQALYGQALAELGKGAADCRAAITPRPNGDESLDIHINATLLRLSVAELAAGAGDVFRSTAEIEIVSRQHY